MGQAAPDVAPGAGPQPGAGDRRPGQGDRRPRGPRIPGAPPADDARPGVQPPGPGAAAPIAPPAEVPPAPPPAPRRVEPPPPAPAPRPPEPVVRPQGDVPAGDRIWLYPEKLNLAPQQDTTHALYRSMMNINRQWLQDGEVRRMSWGRAASIPIIGGLIGGMLKPFAARGSVDVGGKLSPLPPGMAPDQVSKLIHGGKFVAPTGTEYLTGAMQNIGIAGAIAGVLSPIVSGIRRVTGENAFSQFARFANRREDRGLLSRIIHGGESRVMKWLFFREDRDTRQIHRLFDQINQSGDLAWQDLNRLNIGSRDRINNLIAAGVMEEMKAQMIAEHNMQLSPKEMDRINRMHENFRMAQRIFDAKIPTAGQRRIYIDAILPDLLRRREQNLWTQQTVGLAGVGAAKAAGIALLGHVFTFANIDALARGAFGLATQAWEWGYKTTSRVVQPGVVYASKIPGNIVSWADYIAKGNYLPDAVQKIPAWNTP